MFLLFLVILALIPICVGITLLVLFNKNKLSRVILLFLLLATLWQLDVAFLYSHELFNEETISFFFKLFRFGPIMVTPTLFYIGYIMVQETLSNDLQKKWRFLVNRTTVIISYVLAFIVYLIGWTSSGIKDLQLIQEGTNIFYFPIYGEHHWVFQGNIVLFFASTTLCFLVSLKVQNKSERSFLIYFIIFSTIGYLIGTLNMFSTTRLYPSSIAVLVFAVSLLILASRMHIKIVNNMNKKLNEQKKFLFQVIDLNPNYIYAQDKFGRYTLLNQSYAQLMGMDIQAMIGKSDAELQINQNEKKKNLTLEYNMVNSQEKLFIREESLTAATGEKIWVQTAKVPINFNEGSACLAVSTDITERKQYEDEIKFQANHDSLTGLPNRRMFNEDLTNLLEKAKLEKSQSAIMFLDLDRFKYINDTLGHDWGDLLLVEVSRRMESLLKKQHQSAKIYRLGGDEFTVILPYYNSADSEKFANELLALFKNGFIIADSEYFITPSIGISIYPNDGEDANTLIKHADTAMYYVKEKGKNNYQLFNSDMQSNFYRKMMIEKQLRTALDNEEFELYYQPIIDLKTSDIIAMESLLRWNNPILGLVSPDEFISIAEETGMILPIGKWVLNTALKQNIQWQHEGYKSLKTSVNVSVRQLLDPNFVDDVKKVLDNLGINADLVVLEITESIAMYADSMIAKLNTLKDLGISLSMDDFGTGYSSLSYLNKYPLDSLKIDKSFVMGMNQDDENNAIVKTIVAIAQQLDLSVIAEGVEGQEEAHVLNTMGCDFAQGYYFSRPLPANEIKEKWLIARD
ncbi:sensor domain-containing protein [Ureibacillus chungkukjangi]|uniref:PAS domain S-box-containing protein/diguanylate cyclase (GGDEF)-like protein n=1 Tax=Ureibacillus chungkukjangi TaxID=1202712 RepID=A0A318TVC4_9BACL|nr:bifunctional diguanylate cyclase/phosphodiesterase [Ureibacillus chungkukjangi]PYF08293.1 PAS domain S-box-containing protein/diguanylate cyclase (GGDEF)-like protein [Ureibacillus chungkukjangi]